MRLKGGEEEMMDKEIINAIQTLLRTHVSRDHDDPAVPIVQMGAVPEYDDPRYYANAWLLLWKKFDPEQMDRRKKWSPLKLA